MTQPETPRASRSLGRIVSIIVAVALAGLGVTAIVVEGALRAVASEPAARIASGLPGLGALAFTEEPAPTIAYLIDGGWFALRITAECSVAFFAGGLLILGGTLSLVLRLNPLRSACALVAGTAVLILVNQARFLGLGLVRGRLGQEAFEWAHTLGGSVLMLTGVIVALLLFFRIAIAGRAGRRGRLT